MRAHMRAHMPAQNRSRDSHLGSLRKILRLAFALALGISACTRHAIPDATPRLSQIDPSDADTTCAACDDFYRFAEGGWIQRATIPAARPGTSMTAELTDRANT